MGFLFGAVSLCSLSFLGWELRGEPKKVGFWKLPDAVIVQRWDFFSKMVNLEGFFPFFFFCCCYGLLNFVISVNMNQCGVDELSELLVLKHSMFWIVQNQTFLFYSIFLVGYVVVACISLFLFSFFFSQLIPHFSCYWSFWVKF